jgi:hypothetical protein
MSIANAFGLSPPFVGDLTITGDINASGIISGETYYRIDNNDLITQSIPNNAITPVQFPVPYVSNNISAPTSSNTTYTIPVTGFYIISYTVPYENYTGVGFIQAWIQRSSTNIRYGSTSASGFEAAILTPGPPVSGITLGTDSLQLSGCAVMDLNEGETVQIQTYQNSGSAQTIVAYEALATISINFLHL